MLHAVAGNAMHFLLSLCDGESAAAAAVVAAAAGGCHHCRRCRGSHYRAALGIYQRSCRPCCTPWRAMSYIYCCRCAPASPPPSGDFIVVIAAAAVTAGRHLCCCHAPSENFCFVAVRSSSKDGANRWRRPHRHTRRWWRCHYLSCCPALLHVLRLKWDVSCQKKTPKAQVYPVQKFSNVHNGKYCNRWLLCYKKPGLSCAAKSPMVTNKKLSNHQIFCYIGNIR